MQLKKLLTLSLLIFVFSSTTIFAGPANFMGEVILGAYMDDDFPQLASVPPIIQKPNYSGELLPQPGKATIVFIRPPVANRSDGVWDPNVQPYFTGRWLFAWNFNQPVILDSKKLIGIQYPEQRIVYQATPGKHQFQLIGSDIDVMNAEVEAGKIYYVLVSNTGGPTRHLESWTGRFRFQPQNGQLSQHMVDRYLQYSFANYFGQEQITWFKNNSQLLSSIYDRELPQWEKRTDKVTLLKSSGVNPTDKDKKAIVTPQGKPQQVNGTMKMYVPAFTPILDNDKTTKPEPGKALIIFARQQTLPADTNLMATYYYPWLGYVPVLLDNRQFIGLMYPHSRISYQVTPGKHLFMLSYTDADFIEANVEAGKTYYVNVSYYHPKGDRLYYFRFHPLPVTGEKGQKDQLMKMTYAQKVTDDQKQWFKLRSSDVLQTESVNYPRWQQIPDSSKLVIGK